MKMPLLWDRWRPRIYLDRDRSDSRSRSIRLGNHASSCTQCRPSCRHQVLHRRIRERNCRRTRCQCVPAGQSPHQRGRCSRIENAKLVGVCGQDHQGLCRQPRRQGVNGCRCIYTINPAFERISEVGHLASAQVELVVEDRSQALGQGLVFRMLSFPFGVVRPMLRIQRTLAGHQSDSHCEKGRRTAYPRRHITPGHLGRAEGNPHA